MKVILLDDVRSIGRRHDVKDVSDGYARNFLFPNKLAEPASAAALAKLETMKAEHEKEDAELVKRLESVARAINGLGITFALKKGKDGSIFGSVNKEAIHKALREHDLITKERVDIILDHPIKTPGTYTVPVDLKKGIEAKLKVIVEAAE